MQTILNTIVARKREEIAARSRRLPEAKLRDRIAAAEPPRGFAARLRERATRGPAIVAEIKRGSPSLGLVRPDLDVTAQVAAYQRGGAAALSVLTDESFFFGSDADFLAARAAVTLPLLRKEFIIDPWQLLESRALGADCVLLIMAVLTDAQARRLADRAHELGMDTLVETHSAAEIRRAATHVPYDLLGINNRNLKTFETSETLTLELVETVPDRTRVVAESGLHSADAIRRLWARGIGCYLVGEAFVTCAAPEATVREFAHAAASTSH